MGTTATRVLPRPDNWNPVGRPFVARRYDWEPGDATRYEFFVAFNAQGYDLFAWTNLSAGGRSMWLPNHWWSDGLDAGYIAEKMDLNSYNAERVAQFLDLLRSQDPEFVQWAKSDGYEE
jgi:hypothetical protein